MGKHGKDRQTETLKKVFRRLGRYRIFLLFTVLLSVVTVALTLYIPKLTGKAVDCIVTEGQVDFGGVMEILVQIATCILVTAFAQWLMNICNNKMTYQIVRDIRNDAFKKIEILPLKYIDGHPYGEVVSRVIADVDQFADGLLMGFTQLFTGILTIAGTLGIMLAINWVIALIVFVITPLSLFVAKFIASRTYSLFKRTSEIRGEQTAFIDEMIGNLKVVKAFNRDDENLEKFDEINDRLTKASLKSIFYSSLTNPSTRFVNAVVYAAVALSGALMLVLDVSLPIAFSIGMLSSLLSYANQYTKPFNEISGVVTELQNAIACAGRIYEIIDEKEQTPDSDNAVVLENVKGDVVFENVKFSYNPDQKLIEDLNIMAKAGQRIAIVGPTGCGKTTLINLLMRFYDIDDGSIKIDGHTISEVTRRSLRRNYGMVLQDTWLKSGTVKENLNLGKPDAGDDEIEAAARAAHAHNFIMQLPKGYDTVITENSLSQGQKQLLCIARIMLCLPPMLILDEATSSIDTRTELKINAAFARLMKGRTSFIVAHRLSTIKEADLILVMKDGNIIEQGTHDSLLAKGGFYSNLYNSQFAI